MKLVVKGKNLDVSAPLREYVSKKLGRLEKYSHHMIEINAELSVARNKRIQDNQIVEVTVYANGAVIRAEEASADMYASIDLVSDKIERQLKRYEEKKVHRSGSGRLKTSVAITNAVEEAQLLEEANQIVRTKTFSIQTMEPEEAAMQMELLGHQFFAFRHPSDDEINIVYRRQDGDYGMITPNQAEEALV